MTQQTIEEKIKSLNALTADLNPDTFKEKLYCAYRTKLLNALEGCESAQDFERVLATNWAQVKGTALCYTARPDDDLTLLLCEIAEYVGKALNIKPIRLLMPGVVTDSIYLKEDSAYGDYPNLTELPLNQVLKTHILSNSGCHLIAVRTLLELPGPWENNRKPLPMHYDDFTGRAVQYHVTQPELNRLRCHSSHTEALFAAKEDYEALLKDAGFLSHLQTLINGLRFNSTSGIGSEESAGQGAYAALESFTRYYTALGEAAQKIPAELKAALDELIGISSDVEKHRTATISQSCINIRHQALSKLVQDNQIKLADIGVDSVHKGQLLEAAQKRFAGNKQALKAQLAEVPPTYTGQDALGLTHTLLTTYDVKPEITSLRALQDFLTLSPEEMKQIAENMPAVRAGILAQFPDLEALVHFCLTTPLEPLESIIAIMGELLVEKLVTTSEDMSASLMLMEGPRLTIMMQLLKERLPTLINTGFDFWKVLRDLNPEQRNAVYEASKTQLLNLVKSSDDFAEVLHFLSPEQRTGLYEAFKLWLPTLIHDGHDFGMVLQYLNTEQRNAVYETFKAQLPTAIQAFDDLQGLLRYLSPEQCSAVCEALDEKLPNLITGCYGFRSLLQHLNPDQRSVVYEAFKAQLPTLIKSGNDLGCVLEFLSPEQCIAVCDVLKAQLPTLISSGSDFGKALKYLSLEQCSMICDFFKIQLSKLIRNGDEFGDVCECLTSEQRSVVYEAVKDQLPAIINSGSDFGQVIQYLNLEQRNTVYETIKVKLLALIKNSDEFGRVLQYLTPDQCSDVCHAVKAQLPAIIQNAKEFQGVLEYLAPEQRAVVYDAIKTQFPVFIQSSTEFVQVINYLNREQRSAVYETFKEQIPTLIKKSADFGNIIKCLTLEECKEVCELIKADLPMLIKEIFDIRLVFTYLAFSDEKRNVVYEAVKAHLPTLIKEGKELGLVLQHLAPEQCTAVYEAVKAKLPSIIISGDGFGQALEYLTCELRNEVYEASKNKLPTIIRNSYDFYCSLKFLSPEQRTWVYESLKEKILSFINYQDHFDLVLCYLTSQQRMEVFEQFKNELQAAINDGVDFPFPVWLASEKCLNILDCSAQQRQALQAEILAMHESVVQIRNQTFCPGFENRKRSLSQMQETDENGLENEQLDHVSSRANVSSYQP